MRTHHDRQVIEEARRIKLSERKSAKKARPVNQKASRGREGDNGFLAYLRRQPCDARRLGGCGGPIQAAHVRYSDARAGSRNPGLGRKNHDRHCNALCEQHHIFTQHQMKEQEFWCMVGVNAYANAAEHYARYLGDGK